MTTKTFTCDRSCLYGNIIEKWSERLKKKKFPFLFIFNWVSLVCIFNITLREFGRESNRILIPAAILRAWELSYNTFMSSQWWVIEKTRTPYFSSFLRQDVAVTWTTFYRVAGLKSLTNHQDCITAIRFDMGI